MFEKIDFKRSVASLKIKFEGNIFFDRYFILLYPIILMAVAIIFLKADINLFSILSLLLTIGVLLLWIYNIHINDKFTKVPFSGSFVELRKLIETELKKDGWFIYRSNSQLINAGKSGKWFVGCVITILFHNKSILINARNMDGAKGYFPFSFGRNKRLTDKLILFIKHNFIVPSRSLAEDSEV